MISGNLNNFYFPLDVFIAATADTTVVLPVDGECCPHAKFITTAKIDRACEGTLIDKHQAAIFMLETQVFLLAGLLRQDNQGLTFITNIVFKFFNLPR